MKPGRRWPGERTKLLRKTGILVFTLLLLLLNLGCGDQYRPVANPLIGNGGQPQATHFAFVLNSNPAGNSSTFRIDVSGDTNSETQTVGAAAMGESFLGTNLGALFTANSGSDSVSEFSTVSTNNPVTTINLPVGSKPVAIDSVQSNAVYVVNAGSNAICPNSGSLSVINTASLVVTTTVCVGPNPTALTILPNGAKTYVLNQGNNTISIFDQNGNSIIGAIDASRGLSPNAVALVASSDGSYLFVVTKGNGTSNGLLDIVVTANDTVAATAPLGMSPASIYLDPYFNRLYVPNTGSNTVTVFDAASVNVNNNPAIPTLGTSNVGSAPVAVTALPDGSRFYAANSASNDVTVVSATSFLPLKTVPVGTGPVWIASEPGSTKVYTANFSAGTVSIIQTSNDTVTSTIPAPPQNPSCTGSCPLQQPIMILTE